MSAEDDLPPIWTLLSLVAALFRGEVVSRRDAHLENEIAWHSPRQIGEKYKKNDSCVSRTSDSLNYKTLGLVLLATHSTGKSWRAGINAAADCAGLLAERQYRRRLDATEIKLDFRVLTA